MLFVQPETVREQNKSWDGYSHIGLVYSNIASLSKKKQTIDASRLFAARRNGIPKEAMESIHWRQPIPKASTAFQG